MAEIAPFRGIRYDESAVGDLTNVLSPPYDIISPEDRARYHQAHPCNFVRLVLGEEFDSDNDSNNRFTRARSYLDQWIDQGVLRQDEQPSIYVYQQVFEQDGRERAVRGFVCAVRIHDYADKVILPHENTLAKPKSQLIQLIRQTRANLDSIYGLYADEQGVLEALMDRVTSAHPASEARDKDQVRHRLWVVSDSTDIASVVGYLKDRPIAIADGHHRYETSLAYRNEAREKQGCDGAECRELASDFTLMTIVNVHQPGMTIFPTHRVLGDLPGHVLDSLDARLGEFFEVGQSSEGSILDDMRRLGAIGMYRKGDARTLKPKAGSSDLLKGSEASRGLELNILHGLILERILGIDEDRLRNQTNIVYTRDQSEAMRLVDSAERQIAFLLNHIDVKSVLDIASAGEKMPQKATYFYPKLISGLVLRKMA